MSFVCQVLRIFLKIATIFFLYVYRQGTPERKGEAGNGNVVFTFYE